MKITWKQLGCSIKLGTMLHAVTELLTLGNAYAVSGFIAGLFGKKECGCYERELLLNRLTCWCNAKDE